MASGKKRPVGRPRKYDTAEELAPVVEEYFLENQQPTLSGLALACGFADRHSLNEYEQLEEFSTIIKNARAKISDIVEKRVVYSKEPAVGGIFYLKNLQFSDKIDIQQEINEKKEITITVAPEVGSVLDSLRGLADKQELKVIDYNPNEDKED